MVPRIFGMPLTRTVHSNPIENTTCDKGVYIKKSTYPVYPNKSNFIVRKIAQNCPLV